MSTSQARTLWQRWECRKRVRTFIHYHKRAREHYEHREHLSKNDPAFII